MDGPRKYVRTPWGRGGERDGWLRQQQSVSTVEEENGWIGWDGRTRDGGIGGSAGGSFSAAVHVKSTRPFKPAPNAVPQIPDAKAITIRRRPKGIGEAMEGGGGRSGQRPTEKRGLEPGRRGRKTRK
jgi:hypothetical protein